MIIDSHAHYAHPCYANSFRYLDWKEEGYLVREGTMPELFDRMKEQGIRAFVEPAVDLNSNESVLDLSRRYPGKVFPVVGCHPTRCVKEAWRDRRRLEHYADQPGVVAIGETGLDYHYQRRDQHRIRQTAWFLYQLNLAKRKGLPLVLHIRCADRDAIRILKRYKGKQGGVVHCFGGDWETARQYLDLGYHIGIGGALLQPEERAGKLWEAVTNMPLDRILVETDSPYVLPDCKADIGSKTRRKTKNTSLILPAVIRRIAQLKHISPEEVERMTAQNAVRLFRLPEIL